MDVGNDRIYWEQGKIVVFDDSFEHEVWNNTDPVSYTHLRAHET